MRINRNMNSIRLISILLLVTKDSEDKNNYIEIIGYFLYRHNYSANMYSENSEI